MRLLLRLAGAVVMTVLLALMIGPYQNVESASRIWDKAAHFVAFGLILWSLGVLFRRLPRNWAARTAVAIWVLSPISMMKKAAVVVQNTPEKVFSVVSGASSKRSGIRAHTAKPRKARPTAQRTQSPCMKWPSTVPARAAKV